MKAEKIKDIFCNFHWVYKTIGGSTLRWLPDQAYLSLIHVLYFHRRINWENPQRFTEKIQWLKLHDRNPEYPMLADKYEVKKIVADKIGEGHVIPAIGVWDHFDQIDFDSLPQQFVLKTTHDSGGFAICRDKRTFDYNDAKRKLERRLRRNYYWAGRGWAYKDIRPRILAEPYISTLGKDTSVEYKITCFNGKAENITVCRGIAHDALSRRKNNHYDRNLNHLDWWTYYRNGDPDFQFPEAIHDMIRYADILSEGIPQVRVDFYYENGTILFGEMTFYSWDGFMKFHPDSVDFKAGSMLRLPVATNQPKTE